MQGVGGREWSAQPGRDRGVSVKAKAGNLGQASLLTKAFHLSFLFSPKTVRLQQWDSLKHIPDKETFYSVRRSIKEWIPLPPPGALNLLIADAAPFIHIDGAACGFNSFKTGNYARQTADHNAPTPPFLSHMALSW